ncbi:MAG: transcriptional repressor [Phycisphaeraceae bacterium]
MRERQTQQRQAIRKAVERADRPLSPQEILAAAEPAAPGLGMATVYRAVKTGVAEGWLAAVEMPGAGTRYEPAGKHHHHHFACRECGGVFEVDGCPGGIQPLTPTGFKLEDHELLLYGLCRNCNT